MSLVRFPFGCAIVTVILNVYILHGQQFVYPVGNPDIRPHPGDSSLTENGYKVTQGFRTPSHTGIDLANGAEGGSVRAIYPGTVTEVRLDNSGDNVGFGNLIRIRHDVPGVGVIYSQYGHLLSGSIRVAKDNDVDTTTIIADLDCSGYTDGTSVCPSNGKVGPHLHLSIQTIDRRGCGYLPDGRCPHDSFALYLDTDPLEFIEQQRQRSMQGGLITAKATVNSLPWSGPVEYNIVGPHGTIIGLGVPGSTANLPPGTYTMMYKSGGPPNSTLLGVSPSARQNLLAGQSITFTLELATPNQLPQAGFLMSAGGRSASDGQTLNLTVPVACNIPEDGNPDGTVEVTFSAEPPPADPPLSFDPDGTIVGYEWRFSGTIVSTASSFAGELGCGDHVVSLTVIDNRGASRTAEGVISVVAPTPLTPQLTIETLTCSVGNQCSGPTETTFTLRGNGFTPNGTVRRIRIGSDGIPMELQPLLSANRAGEISWSFTTDCDTLIGNFLISAVDVATGISSNSVMEIHQPGRCPLSQKLFFDGEGVLGIGNVRFDEPAIDNTGNLLVVSVHTSVSCDPFGLCGIKLHSIAPSGTLNWSVPQLSQLSEYIAADNFAPRSLSLDPNDRVYLQGARATLYAYEPDGSPALGWPVTIPGGFNWRFGTENAVAIDDRDGTVYARIGETRSFSAFPAAIVSISRDGLDSNSSPVWRTEYSDGGGPGPIILGPARDVYSIINGRLVALDHGSGVEICEGPPAPFFNGFAGGLEGIFTGHNNRITAYDVNCNSSDIFTTDRDTIGVRTFDQGRVFAIDYPVPFSPDLVRLLSVLRDGSGFWRNPSIVVSSSENPIRAIEFGVLYVLGYDSTDENKHKLFLVDAASGAILNSFETAPACSSCGVAVAPDGAIYLNDLSSTKVYKLN